MHIGGTSVLIRRLFDQHRAVFFTERLKKTKQVNTQLQLQTFFQEEENQRQKLWIPEVVFHEIYAPIKCLTI